MSRRKKGVGWEARIATPPEYRFVEFEGDADAVATIFVNRDEGDIDIDGANFDVVELVFGRVSGQECGAETAIFVGAGANGTTATAMNFAIASIIGIEDIRDA